MRRLWTSLLTLCLVVVGMGAGVSSASASSSKAAVTIAKLSSKTAPYKSKVTVKPKVSHSKSAKLTSARLSVKKSGRTVATNKSSVKLGAGTYKVTTTARYKTFRTKKETTTRTTNPVTVLDYEDTRVTCVATRVTDEGVDALSLDGSCTGTAFDGTVALRNLDAINAGGWLGIDDDYDMLEFSYVPAVGTRFAAWLTPGTDLHKKKTVRVTSTKKVWSATKTTKRTQTLVIKAGKKPNHAAPYASGECPGWAPIKGNADSGIYHVPGGRYYAVTMAEECFTTASAARAHGYRASRNG